VEGVRPVRNLLTGEPAADRHAIVSDAQLEKDVKAALSGAPALADSSIASTASSVRPTLA